MQMHSVYVIWLGLGLGMLLLLKSQPHKCIYDFIVLLLLLLAVPNGEISFLNLLLLLLALLAAVTDKHTLCFQ